MQQKSLRGTNVLDTEFSYVGYLSKDVEGECTLKYIRAMKQNRLRFFTYSLVSIFTIGIPLLLSFWYIDFKRWCYYDFCSIQQATHFYVLNYDNQFTIVERLRGKIHSNDLSSSEKMYFINRFMKYYYDEETKQFTPVTYDFLPRVNKLVNEKDRIRGYDKELVDTLRTSYGQCAMQIPTPSCMKLFITEVLQPFFIFIIYSTILWYYEVYLYYASIILFTSTVSIGINLYLVMQLNQKIFEMAFYQTRMAILRQNQVIQTTSIDIVPGDIVFLKKSIKLPFDGILLGGSVLMNECALTGQSVPIVKKAIDKQQFNELKTVDKSALLYEGTQLVQICSQSRNPAHKQFEEIGLLVCVTRTNFSTTKGQLIRIISFPKGREIKFYIESAKFVLFLFGLSIATFILLSIYLRQYVTTTDIIKKFFDLITITVPPALPASMSIGLGYSIYKLQEERIYCISPDKVIPGGRIQHICFDKTGTLTEDFMDFYEFVPIQKSAFLDPINLETREKSEYKAILTESKESILALNNMAACHSIMNLQNTDKLIGDPMEIKLFEFGRFKLVPESSVMKNYKQSLFSFRGPKYEGTVFRRFEFNSEIQRMSVIASSSDEPDSAYIYVKGAPETMKNIMIPKGIPENYIETMEKYTSCGFRVLAVGSKKIKLEDIETIDRTNSEKDLDFNGFEVFQNKLKPETYGAIQTLKEAGISIVIITGDNVLTGANIGFKSGVIDQDKNIMICDILPDKRVKVTNFYQQNNQKATSKIIEEEVELQKEKIKTEKNFECSLAEFPTQAVEIAKRTKNNYVFCVTGSLFAAVFTEQQQLTPIKKQFIKSIKVFARSKPNDKTRAVVVFQSLGKITAMCGDGANDCGALKQSDAGLSLSEAEASISSPFTSKISNISSMITLIRECRGGLATNFSVFNIMALYSLIQYSNTVIAEYYFGYPSDFQYMYVDIAHNFIFFLTLGYTQSLPKLSKLRPNDSLFSISNISSVVIMFLLQFAGQVGVIALMAKSPFTNDIQYNQRAGSYWNKFAYDANGGFVLYTAQVQSLFMYANFLYTFSLLAFSVSNPWKKLFITNIPFMIVFVIVFTYDILLCLIPSIRFSKFLMKTDYLPLNFDYQAVILGYALASGLLLYVNQKYILEPAFNYLREKYPEKQWI